MAALRPARTGRRGRYGEVGGQPLQSIVWQRQKSTASRWVRPASVPVMARSLAGQPEGRPGPDPEDWRQLLAPMARSELGPHLFRHSPSDHGLPEAGASPPVTWSDLAPTDQRTVDLGGWVGARLTTLCDHFPIPGSGGPPGRNPRCSRTAASSSGTGLTPLSMDVKAAMLPRQVEAGHSPGRGWPEVLIWDRCDRDWSAGAEGPRGPRLNSTSDARERPPLLPPAAAPKPPGRNRPP